MQLLHQFKGFKHHSLCSRINPTHLCFADDLLMFSRGDIQSVNIMIKAFEMFSAASGLKMSARKSNFYYNGIPDSIVHAIAHATGMQRGVLSFRYLGVNIIPKRLGVLDCQCLVDKITERISRLGARKLSYTSRVVLIKAVLSALHNYRARISILPKNVLDKIDAICKKFLWHGGLGILNCHVRNIAVLGKYSWWIAKKKDSLWVKWVHNIYIKQSDWWQYSPSSNASWTWRQICKVKEKLKVGFLTGAWQSSYYVHHVYHWLLGAHQKKEWLPFVWNRDEKHSHLFFDCSYSQICMKLLQAWLKITWQGNVVQWVL
ncbi:uncharacterized protein LOC141629072 [Silene latifolia]|uniref:uncharacterized protein LOC141629072 n=1 Tax=Silene latifolia TaxID=37657 RepID=UPI003D783734